MKRLVAVVVFLVFLIVGIAMAGDFSGKYCSENDEDVFIFSESGKMTWRKNSGEKIQGTYKKKMAKQDVAGSGDTRCTGTYWSVDISLSDGDLLLGTIQTVECNSSYAPSIASGNIDGIDVSKNNCGK
jgi:hypothetical protein